MIPERPASEPPPEGRAPDGTGTTGTGTTGTGTSGTGTTGTGPVCATCRTVAATALPLTWSASTEAGRRVWICDRCAREHVRSIEAKLDSAWW